MFRSSFTRAAALAAVLGTIATASYAAPSDDSSMSGDSAMTSQTTTTTTSKKMSGDHHHMMKPPSPEEMKAHVEEHIKTLHDKLMITSDEESAWNDVAQAMRDNEANLSSLMQERHDSSTADRTAVDDLESYQKIAQAHADGLAKVTTAFETLYDAMPDDQKKNADKVFGTYEGHMGPDHHGPMKHKPMKAPAATPAPAGQ